MAGSSPLTRGKYPDDGADGHRMGLIPAHAGKIYPTKWRRARPGGSSPLTRGKYERAQMRVDLEGLIPAHAGKIASLRPGPTVTRAHPRSRGENPCPSIQASATRGSSPLTRGKCGRVGAQEGVERLIPAHAGKMVKGSASEGRIGAHPRSRGENIISRDGTFVARGSSPLTRGKWIRAACPPTATGLIPAHAGKIPRYRRLRKPRTAHPRSRGENARDDEMGTVRHGSSPLTRGKSSRAFTPLVAGGLIPAHAGKISPALPRRSSLGAHPRSRGENTICATVSPPRTGSSPLTRGKSQHVAGDRLRDGLIPAHAGKML